LAQAELKGRLLFHVEQHSVEAIQFCNKTHHGLMQAERPGLSMTVLFKLTMDKEAGRCNIGGAMSNPLKKPKAVIKFYSIPGIAAKIGRNRGSVRAAIRRLGITPCGSYNDRPAYSGEAADIIAASLRKPNTPTRTK
jgi:hypothetical protein